MPTFSGELSENACVGSGCQSKRGNSRKRLYFRVWGHMHVFLCTMPVETINCIVSNDFDWNLSGMLEISMSCAKQQNYHIGEGV